MTNIREELLYTIKLLKSEWKEDLEQFKKISQSKPLKERKASGICWYPVRLVKIKWIFSDKMVLELENQEKLESHAFNSGKTVSLFSNAAGDDIQKSRTSGVVNMVTDKKMVITLYTGKIPRWINEGRLGIDLMFDETSYTIMEKTMLKVLEADKDRLATLRDRLLGAGRPVFNRSVDIDVPVLNRGQNQAFNLIDSAVDVAIVHGPPGTGKTTTLIQSILFSLNTSPQVLVCAPSNAAVDLLVEKLFEAGVNVLRIGHPARVEEEMLNQTLDAKIVNHPSYKDYKKLRKSAEECRRNAGKYKRSFGHHEKMQRRALRDEASRLLEDADQLYEYMTHTVLESAQVIACTMVGSASPFLKGRRFSTVFIDEAAQGLEPATWIPVLNAEKVVMAGDHCQLPPTIKSLRAAKDGLQQTLFEKIVKRNPEAISMLDLQYRMPDLIMGFPNASFYQNKLKAAPGTSLHFLREDESVLEFIDTAGSGFTEYLDKKSLSVFNKEEAKASLEILTNLLKRVGVKDKEGRLWSIGLVSPYSAQVRYLKDLVAEDAGCVLLRSLDKNLTVNTIDGFQGQERDIMVISVVRSNPQGEIGFLADTRRMNVALTRAKRKLLVIGDSATLANHPFYQLFLDYVQDRNCYKSIYEYLSF
ncbi:AAA domain-containing protein [Negadavirga shengliensis]|uniref:DNA helicase n=1 Tax=Negadavirga shengliensis TaxID=1389218 RepID=A0ABV9T7H6_9BACT